MRKYAKYTELKARCVNREWKATRYPFKIRRNFLGTSFQKWLRHLDVNRREVTRLTKKAVEATEAGLT